MQHIKWKPKTLNPLGPVCKRKIHFSKLRFRHKISHYWVKSTKKMNENFRPSIYNLERTGKILAAPVKILPFWLIHFWEKKLDLMNITSFISQVETLLEIFPNLFYRRSLEKMLPTLPRQCVFASLHTQTGNEKKPQQKQTKKLGNKCSITVFPLKTQFFSRERQKSSHFYENLNTL